MKTSIRNICTGIVAILLIVKIFSTQAISNINRYTLNLTPINKKATIFAFNTSITTFDMPYMNLLYTLLDLNLTQINYVSLDLKSKEKVLLPSYRLTAKPSSKEELLGKNRLIYNKLIGIMDIEIETDMYSISEYVSKERELISYQTIPNTIQHKIYKYYSTLPLTTANKVEVPSIVNASDSNSYVVFAETADNYLLYKTDSKSSVIPVMKGRNTFSYNGEIHYIEGVYIK